MDYNKILSALQEDWDSFLTKIPGIALAILIVAVGFFLANKISGFTKKVIKRKTSDPLMSNFLGKTIQIILVSFVVMIALKAAGLQGIASALFTAAGASALILGFAFKDIGENFISGIILSFNRPFNVNDTVKIGDIFGKVKTMEFRYTKLKTFDGKDVYIPNSDVIKKPVFNYTEDGYFRMDFVVGIAYENNAALAEKIILEAVHRSKNILCEMDKEAFSAIEELGVNSVNIRVYFWINSMDYRKEALKIKSEIIADVKESLLKNNISMPANIQELKWYKEDLPTDAE